MDLERQILEDLGIQVHCKGGGGGGGTSTIPSYLQAAHSYMINREGTIGMPLLDNLYSVMSDALHANPFAAVFAYESLNDLGTMNTYINNLNSKVLALSPLNDWRNYYSNALNHLNSNTNELTVNAQINAFRAILDEDMQAQVLPEFEGGMRDINAVLSSAFIIGKALIMDGRERKLIAYGAELKHKLFLWRHEAALASTNTIIDMVNKQLGFYEVVARDMMESTRMRIIARREDSAEAIRVIETKATWKFDVFSYAGNFLASVSGGVSSPVPKGMSPTSSALSGALSGAATGAMVGNAVPGIGTAVGAVGGAIIGGLGGLLA